MLTIGNEKRKSVSSKPFYMVLLFGLISLVLTLLFYGAVLGGGVYIVVKVLQHCGII